MFSNKLSFTINVLYRLELLLSTQVLPRILQEITNTHSILAHVKFHIVDFKVVYIVFIVPVWHLVYNIREKSIVHIIKGFDNYVCLYKVPSVRVVNYVSKP